MNAWATRWPVYLLPRCAALTTLALCILGCGGSNLASVAGVVQVSGKPACAGRAVFLPVGGGKPAIGDIGPDGRFTLVTAGREDGAEIAVHHVVLKDVRCEGDAEGRDYRSTEEMRVTVQANAENSFSIDVDVKNGWQLIPKD